MADKKMILAYLKNNKDEILQNSIKSPSNKMNMLGNKIKEIKTKILDEFFATKIPMEIKIGNNTIKFEKNILSSYINNYPMQGIELDKLQGEYDIIKNKIAEIYTKKAEEIKKLEFDIMFNGIEPDIISRFEKLLL